MKNAPNCGRHGNPVEPRPAKSLPLLMYAFLGSAVVMPCLSGATTSSYTDKLGFFLPFALLFPFVLPLLQSRYDDGDRDCKIPREYPVTRVGTLRGRRS